MTTHVPPAQPTTTTLPQIEVPAWAWAIVLFAALAMYFVTLENGALLGSLAETAHEFFHDGRHIAAVPCH